MNRRKMLKVSLLSGGALLLAAEDDPPKPALSIGRNHTRRCRLLLAGRFCGNVDVTRAVPSEDYSQADSLR
jgi:hypothetical protein